MQPRDQLSAQVDTFLLEIVIFIDELHQKPANPYPVLNRQEDYASRGSIRFYAERGR
jgi:hypothetical protein